MKQSFIYINRMLLVALILIAPYGLFAQEKAATTATSSESSWFNASSILLLLTIFTLSAVIYILGRIVKNLIEADTQEEAKKNKISKGLLALIILIMMNQSIFAQEVKAVASSHSSLIFGMDATLFWVMIAVLFFEFIVVMYLCKILYVFLVKRNLIQPIKTELPKWLQFNSMMGNDLPIEKESEMLTDHDYDGIQELDNGMPPFLKYIFIATVLAAIIYWVNYETLQTGPNQIQEYETELANAEIAKQEYLKTAGNSVDENTVKLLADATTIGNGQKVFATNCVACHGDKGQGGVGPNLTDNAWLHGGDIQSVFKTIKYGVVAKGMRSWQSEIKPGDIQAVASYILTEFKNKNVAGGKPPQGEIMKEGNQSVSVADSTKTSVSDSTKK